MDKLTPCFLGICACVLPLRKYYLSVYKKLLILYFEMLKITFFIEENLDFRNEGSYSLVKSVLTYLKSDFNCLMSLAGSGSVNIILCGRSLIRKCSVFIADRLQKKVMAF